MEMSGYINGPSKHAISTPFNEVKNKKTSSTSNLSVVNRMRGTKDVGVHVVTFLSLNC